MGAERTPYAGRLLRSGRCKSTRSKPLSGSQMRFPGSIFVVLLLIPALFGQTGKTATPAGATSRTPAPAVKSAASAGTAAVKASGDGQSTAVASNTTQQARSETLHFSVNWPSGLSLGEGELSSSFSPASGWSFSMRVDAALPGFPITEAVSSLAGSDLCSSELTKESTRGRRKTTEKTVFDNSKMVATRRTVTNDGGKTEYRIPGCARDALAFVQYARRELAAGRLPQAQQVFYGAPYQTRLQYVGTQRVRSGNDMVDADKL